MIRPPLQQCYTQVNDQDKYEEHYACRDQRFAVQAGCIAHLDDNVACHRAQALEQALLYPKQSVKLTQTTKNIMSVNVPVYDFQTQTRSDADIYPYGFAATSGELDGAVDALSGVFQDMLKLAEIEKTSQLLAEEIEKTRRRVNALEYVKIPQMEEAIQYITMKLDENERSNTIRLMKVKDMLLKEAIEERREEDARAARVFGSSGEAPQEV